MIPCYKNFTLIINRTKPQETSTRRSSKRFPSQTFTINYSGAWVYPDECNFCKLHTINGNGKQQTPHIVVQMNVVSTITAAAKIKDLHLYNEMFDLYLFAKEFKYHSKCYNSFTYGYSSSMKNGEKEATDDNRLKPNSKFDWEAVKSFISQQFLLEKKGVSTHFLHGLYKLNPSDTKLKTRICNEFSESLTFLAPANNQAEVVISTSVLSEQFHLSDDRILKNVAYHLRQDILNFANKLPQPKWPPTPDELTSYERNPPKLVTHFLTYFLKPQKHSVSGNVNRLIESYAAYMIYGVTKGKTIPAKHFLLAVGLHITRKKMVVEINNKFGQCINYNTTCEIETAQAMRAQQLTEKSLILPKILNSDKNIVLMYFWADNFDHIVDNQAGGGAINTTHLVAFEQKNDNCHHKSNLNNN